MVVALAGDLDIATLPQLQRALSDPRIDSDVVILDLRDLEFIDCGGARLLMKIGRRIGWTQE